MQCRIMPASIHSTEMCYLCDTVCALNIKYVNSMNQICVLFYLNTNFGHDLALSEAIR